MPNPINVPITPPRVPFIDSRTGNVSREWYMFFLSLFQLTSGSSVSLDDLQKSPPSLTVDEVNQFVENAVNDLLQSQQNVTEQVTELQKQIQSLEVLPKPELGTLAAIQQDNVPWLKFDTTPENFPTGAIANGTLYWDSADSLKTLNLVMEDSGNVVQPIGEKTYYRIKATSAITKGQVVMYTGAVGLSGGITGAPATGLTSIQNEYILGIAAQDIANNAWGYVSWFGVLRGVNTTGGAEAWVDGQILYYNPAVAGGLTKTVPTAPNPKVIVAFVVHASSNGILFIRPTFGSALGVTDSNVQIGTLANGNLLIYNNTSNRWENATLTAGSNVTITNGAGSITIASTNSGGTVTSVAASGGTTGLTFSGSPITSSGTFTLSGTLVTTNGGTGLSSFTAGDIMYYTSGTALSKLAIGANNYVLTSNGTTPTWTANTGTGSVARASQPSFTTTIGVGGASASGSGSGISFPATQSASTDANTLDDYEENTWTPTVTASSGSITSYTLNGANYTKIGRVVHVNVDLTITNAGTASGSLDVTLPFTNGSVIANGTGRENALTGYQLQCRVLSSSSTMNIQTYSNTTPIATNAQIRASMTYFT